MDIKSAKFEISNVDVDKCPAHEAPEYAFIGRSNVGKSSLINMLAGRKGLAKTSSMPGKTLLINHFSINDGQWWIVDLPGYGYASRGMKQRQEIKRIIDSYVQRRSQLTCLFVLLDIRHSPQKIDLEFISYLGENGVPFALVFTKADKISGAAAEKNVEAYKKNLLENWEELPPIFVTSSEKRKGKEELLDYIDGINSQLAATCKEEKQEEAACTEDSQNEESHENNQEN